MKDDLKSEVVCVVGLGYVGLPLAQAFARSLSVIAFDIDFWRVNQLTQLKLIKQPSTIPSPYISKRFTSHSVAKRGTSPRASKHRNKSSLPIYPEMSVEQIEKISEIIKNFSDQYTGVS